MARHGGGLAGFRLILNFSIQVRFHHHQSNLLKFATNILGNIPVLKSCFVSQREIAGVEHFNINRTTIRAWTKQIRIC